MFQGFRRRLTYANVTATLALVFAMSGGAYAAGRYLITSPKQISPKVLNELKGRRGQTGAAGAAGAQGQQGAQGPAGPQGSTGEKGAAGSAGNEGAQGPVGPAGPQGPAGPAGTSVKSRKLTGKEGECENGGSEFKVGTATATYACNGTSGSGGSGTLEPGKTEVGSWAVTMSQLGENAAEGYTGFAAITFPVPLAKGSEVDVHYLPEGSSPSEECPGSVEQPTAAVGNFCAYGKLSGHPPFFTALFEPSQETGVVLWFLNEEHPGGADVGSWALTAPEA